MSNLESKFFAVSPFFVADFELLSSRRSDTPKRTELWSSGDVGPVGVTVSEVSAPGIVAWVSETSSGVTKEFFGRSLRGDKTGVTAFADLEDLAVQLVFGQTQCLVIYNLAIEANSAPTNKAPRLVVSIGEFG